MTYRFAFALTTALGNETRYLNLRKYADRIAGVDCVWAPITHYLEPDPYRRWPGPLHTQKVLNHQAAAIFDEWSTLDAVVVHAFQLHAFLALFRRFRRHRPVLALFQDYAPLRDLTLLRDYGHDVSEGWKRSLRFRLERAATRQADVYLPWSEWAKRLLVDDCDVDPRDVHVVQVGVDLALWPYVDPAPEAGRTRKVRLLFVGGDFVRKGGDTLLTAYRDGLADVAELDLVTRDIPVGLPPGVRAHTDLRPNDGRLRDLYRACDVFVLPTRADMSSIASIEAMATGRPVIATTVGGVPDVVTDGVSGFLVPPGDVGALRARLAELVADAGLRDRMGRAGRADVESRLNAEAGAARIIEVLSAAVDARR